MARDLPPFACDLRLVWLGRMHSLDMAARNYFAHDDPGGNTPFDRMESAGISYESAAENLAESPSPTEAHTGWMDSTTHREHVLGDTEFAGVGIAPKDGSTLFFSAELYR